MSTVIIIVLALAAIYALIVRPILANKAYDKQVREYWTEHHPGEELDQNKAKQEYAEMLAEKMMQEQSQK